jgi:hypothetical protein
MTEAKKRAKRKASNLPVYLDRHKANLSEIETFLAAKLVDLPAAIRRRLARGLLSKADKVFLEHLKLLARLSPVDQGGRQALPSHLEKLLTDQGYLFPKPYDDRSTIGEDVEAQDDADDE